MPRAAFILFPLLAITLAGDVPQSYVPPPLRNGTTPGRFQIITGSALDIEDHTAPVILRLDTATGQTWRFTTTPARIDVGTHENLIAIDNWTEVYEDYVSTVAFMQRNSTAALTNLHPTPNKTEKRQ